ncbi:MAG: hypothetical protein BVN34_09045 [Proteobacteria bacterium ST_bin12]|nr:MAG: hypothetical protein BVN34_09045 [Proteobacteria bacterium ST_bin12]
MSHLYISQFNVGAKPIETHWFVGLHQHHDGAYSVRAALKNVDDHQFHLSILPIGLLPILTHGQVYIEGKLMTLSLKGLIATEFIEDLSKYEEITSSDIPHDLYSFHGRQAGTQRLLRYTTQDAEIYIPTIELIRYLFLHNRTLANALMRPSALSLLYRPDMPGFRKELRLEFTKEMPIRSLSNKFAQEFAWIAFDIEARKSWDSVYLKSKGQEYLTLSPPPLQDSHLRFRGINAGNRWLVLEILSMTGRHLPCESLIYSHPQLKKPRIIEQEKPAGDLGGKTKDGTIGQPKKYEYEYKLENGSNGVQSLAKQKALVEVTKFTEFDKAIVVEKLFVDTETTVVKPESSENSPAKKEQKTVWVSAAEQGLNAEVQPIEFKVLTPATWDSVGDLEGTVKTIERLSTFCPRANIAMSLCHLKSGRAFSMANRSPRVALVVVVEIDANPPIVLIDIERTGVPALSVRMLRFKQHVTFESMESYIKHMLDGLVDSSGHWDTTIEISCDECCTFERLPKMFTPRNEIISEEQAGKWAIKLLNKMRN